MFTSSKLPYALLLVAIVAIAWLLLSDDRPQPGSVANPALEQLLMERLAEIDTRLDAIQSSSGQVVVSAPKNPPAALESEVKALMERIAVLEKREADSATKSTPSAIDPQKARERLMANIAQSSAAMNEPPAAATHFEESDNLDASERVALEDVESIFESDELPNTTLSSVNCREGYCRMEYKVNEAIDPATKEIEENELILKLAQKYGSGTNVYMGMPPADGSMQIYIELPKR
jgi:hypothetical protein